MRFTAARVSDDDDSSPSSGWWWANGVRVICLLVNCQLSIVNLGSFLFAFLFCFFLSVCIYISLFLLFPEEKRGRKKGGGERGRRGEVVDVDVVN